MDENNIEKMSEQFPYELQYARPESNIQLSICERGWQHCSPNYAFGEKRDYYILHYIVSGRGEYTIENRTVALGENQLFLIPPNTICSYKADSVEPWVYSWVGFSGSKAKEYLRSIGFIDDGVYYLDIAEHVLAQEYFKKIVFREGKGAKDTLYMIGNLYLLFSELMVKENVKKECSRFTEHVEKAIAYMNDNFTKNITIESLANYIGFDRSHFFKIFKHSVGISPKEYLSNLRMITAKKLLGENKMTILAIAKSVGYESLSNFSKCFKNKYGITPSEYILEPYEIKNK